MKNRFKRLFPRIPLCPFRWIEIVKVGFIIAAIKRTVDLPLYD